MAEVSVIVPSYNYGHYVGEAITSVLSQTFKDLEIIIVDDGSTDNTKFVIDNFKDPRIRYIYQENSGLPSARNTGIAASSGKFIGLLDADDLWLPAKLETQILLLRTKPNVGLVYSGYFVIDESGSIIATRLGYEVDGEILANLILGNFVSGSATTSLIRRDCFDQVGAFDGSFKSCEDWDMWLRIARITEFSYTKQPLAKIRIHSDSMSQDPMRMEAGLFSVVEKFYSDDNLSPKILSLKPRALACAHRSSADFYYRSEQFGMVFKHLFNAAKIMPTWWKLYWIIANRIIGYILSKDPSRVKS